MSIETFDVVIVGGGNAGIGVTGPVRRAGMSARAGAEVAILEALPQLLPAMDADAVAHLEGENALIGIRVRTGVSVSRIEPANGRLRVVFTDQGTEHGLEADRVVNGAGRWPMSIRSISP